MMPRTSNIPECVDDNVAAQNSPSRVHSNRMRARKRSAGFVAGRPRMRRGQVLLIVVTAMVLLASLVFFVYNLGVNTNSRIEMQNAADSAAISGSEWMARSMNIIASNNVTIARMIGVAAVLDAVPFAAEMSADEIETELNGDSLQKGLANQLARGVPETRFEQTALRGDANNGLHPFLKDGLTAIYQQLNDSAINGNMSGQLAQLKQIDQEMDSEDERQKDGAPIQVKNYTWWDPGTGNRGSIWTACTAMDDLSQAMTEVAGVLAQENAVRSGSAANNKADAAFLVPIDPNIPARRGTFRDFHPVLGGKIAVRQAGAQVNDQNIISTATLEGMQYTYSMPIYPIIQKLNDLISQLETLGKQMDADANSIKPMYDKNWDTMDPKTSERKQFDALSSKLTGEEIKYRSLDDQRLRILGSLHNSAPGGAIPDYAAYYRLGPFFKRTDWPFRQPITVTQQISPGSPAGRQGVPGFGSSGTPGVSKTEVVGYQSTGPYHWAIHNVWYSLGWGGQTGTANVTRMGSNLALIANFKMAYLFGMTQKQKIRYGLRWITDYQDAQKYLAEEDSRRVAAHKKGQSYVSKILRTRWYVTQAETADVSWNDPKWLVAKAYPQDRAPYYSWSGLEGNPPARWIREYYGWRDLSKNASYQTVPANRPDIVEMNFSQVNQYCWRFRLHQYYGDKSDPNNPLITKDDAVNGFPRILADSNDANSYIPRHFYFAQWMVFGGMQIYLYEQEIQNPFNWVDGSQDIPCPMLLDTSGGDYTPENDGAWRQSWFSYLGIARKTNTSAVFQERFPQLSPIKSIVAMAQSEVFNNKSWDLWTADWQTQLMPIRGWQQWAQRLESGIADVPAIRNKISESEVSKMSTYMNNISDTMATQYLDH